MKKTILLVVVCFLFVGCAALFAEDQPSCLNPAHSDYNKPLIGGMCGKCGKTFMLSGAQINSGKIGACPYCGYQQNLKDACNRYGMATKAKEGKKSR